MSEYESAWTINCGQFASIALFTVDFLDTLPLEINTFWGGNSKISLVKILYFVSRYGMLLMMAMQLWFLMSIPVSENACAVTQYVYFMFVELPPTCASALLLIRAWAICSRNRLILGLGIVLMLFPPVYDFYEFFGISSPDIITEPADESFLFAQCTVSHLPTKFNRKIEKMYSIGYPGFELAFDTLVFVAILSRTYKLILETRRLGQKSVIEQITKDGALYYLAVLMAQGWDVATSIATFRNVCLPTHRKFKSVV
ncbi:hypothetical protein BC629DRAFT_317080 [Irpex lacteus]|nr:hypothetical protein BC629DRAFT_317080 [Irpex lacteus]